MIEIVKATGDDLQTIHDMAQVVFRHTYRDILSPEQMEYMMDMMYSLPNLQAQLDEGHHYYIAYMSPDQESSAYQEDNTHQESSAYQEDIARQEDSTLRGDGELCRCNDVASSDDSASAVCKARASIPPVPCGYVSVQHEGPDQDGTEIFHLHKIYVMPQAQGRGVGLRLFQTVIQHVRAALQPRANESVTAIGKTEGATTIGKTESVTAIRRPALSPSTPALTTLSSALAPSAPCPAKARIELNVNKFNSAVKFYKHLGMRILLEEDFPIGNGFYKTDYIMGLDV